MFYQKATQIELSDLIPDRQHVNLKKDSKRSLVKKKTIIKPTVFSSYSISKLHYTIIIRFS